MLYPNHWRESVMLSAMTNPIAVPGGGPAMRGGASRLDSAQGAHWQPRPAALSGFARFGKTAPGLLRLERAIAREGWAAPLHCDINN